MLIVRLIRGYVMLGFFRTILKVTRYATKKAHEETERMRNYRKY